MLQINIGKFADKRLEGNDQDIAEHIVVTQDGAGKVKVYAPNLDVSEAEAQRYDLRADGSNPPRSIVLGGDGDDIIDLSGITDAGVIYEIDGGGGNDTIILGAGRGIVRGGEGDDIITGSQGDDIIYGEGGVDRILGLGGNDDLHAWCWSACSVVVQRHRNRS